MTYADFKTSLTGAAPPDGLPVALQALWHVAGVRAVNEAWEEAHRLAQSDESAEAAWTHAHLHRIEGDLRNAGYWYKRAGKPECTADLAAEWEEIVTALT